MTRSSLPKLLMESLATSASGYAAVIDGVLNVRTVADIPNAAAINALAIKGFQVASMCRNPDCDCLVKLMQQYVPDARIVSVNVAVGPEA